jgi:hypothetical protein
MDEIVRQEITQVAAVVEDCRPELNLAAIEAKMLGYEQTEIPLEHIFSAGVYLRQITIPAGTIVMGKRHRNATCNILLRGTLQVFVESDKPPITIVGPHIFTSPPGAKKFALCLEDAVFLNIFPTNETDHEVIEKQVVIPEEEYLALKEAEKCLLLDQQ